MVFRVSFAALLLLSLVLVPLPFPTSTAAAPDLKLPFASGTKAGIVQGYNTGTHQGPERLALDLVLLGAPTSGAPVLMPAAGKVAWAYDPGVASGCFAAALSDAAGLYVMLCHVLLDRVLNEGERLERGQRVGTVGAPGTVANNGLAHIHMALYRLSGGARQPVPFALPDGLPLEGTNLPEDGVAAYLCRTLPACAGLTSTNAASAGTAPATTGKTMVVTGTGDCLRVREAPAMSARVLTCLPDGARVTVKDGTRRADGYDWLQLDTGGWAVATYLTAAGGPANIAAAPNPCAGDERMAFSPSQPTAGQQFTVLVTSARPSTDVTLTGPGDPTFVDATTRGKDVVWRWTVSPSAPGRYDYNFILKSTVCTTNFVLVSPAAGTPSGPDGKGEAASPAPPPPSTTSGPPSAPAPAEAPAVAGPTAVVATDASCLNVRAAPGLDSPVLACLPDGTRVPLTDERVEADGYTWRHIPDQGWAVGDYLHE